MTKDIVVDSNIFIVTLVDESRLNSEEIIQRPLVIDYIEGIGEGRYKVHLPTIAVIEIVGVVRVKGGVGIASAVKSRLSDWVNQGLITLHELDHIRTKTAVDLVMEHNISRRRRLSAPDATFICLAEELGTQLVTLEKYFASVSQRALVPA